MKAGLVALAAVGVGLLWTGLAWTAPQPSEVPIRWELEFRYQPLQAVSVQVPGEPAARLFWYLRYEVVNRTKDDRVFVPGFLMYTQTGQLAPAGRKVPAYVFDYLKKTLSDPLLKDIAGVTGKLLQGEDNAKDGLAIWPDFDPQAGGVSVFVEGLSGETAEVALPTPVEVTEPDPMGNPRTVTKDKLILAKTLQLVYSIPGQPEARLRTPVKLEAKNWVMR
jgi:hypothetical protein